jgi:hypothetical protein
MNRTVTSIALTVALLAGGAASADANTYRIDPNEQSTANVRAYRPTDAGVKVCVSALKWAHAKPTAYREDRAVMICGMTVRTERQAASLYRWAKNRKWALALIG